MLRYLFGCQFADGSEYHQTQEDKSEINPEKSAFYDVLEKDKTTKIKKFWLKGEKDYYLVDLEDGHFEINGCAFDAHDQFFVPQHLRLIYFREVHAPLTHEFKPMGEIYVNRYFIGWQTTVDGTNVQQTIAIN